MLVLIKSHNCIYTNQILSPIFYLSVEKTREPKDKQLCIAVHTINRYIHDADPLDNSSNKAYVTHMKLGKIQGIAWF